MFRFGLAMRYEVTLRNISGVDWSSELVKSGDVIQFWEEEANKGDSFGESAMVMLPVWSVLLLFIGDGTVTWPASQTFPCDAMLFATDVSPGSVQTV